MSDIRSPLSATASLTAVSACAASGISAARDTLENPTPLTATLHRLSHIGSLLNSASSAAPLPPPNPPPIQGEVISGSPSPGWGRSGVGVMQWPIGPAGYYLGSSPSTVAA